MPAIASRTTVEVVGRVEPTSRLEDLVRPMLPKLLAYLLSFVLVGIYWNNHHHLFHLVERVDAAVMWSNMALLFSLSLFGVPMSGLQLSQMQALNRELGRLCADPPRQAFAVCRIHARLVRAM